MKQVSSLNSLRRPKQLCCHMPGTVPGIWHSRDMYTRPGTVPGQALNGLNIEKDTNDIMQTMNELRAQFQKARECIDHLPGTQHSQEEQLRLKSILHQQLMIKTKLLMTYKSGHHFELESKNNGDVASGSNLI
ncbi:mediator of RNA polymerase II transcription subunit 9-like [Elysia marginata]|uniref:Mediator of RNA polymerase II transcription subunit 9 n=1 Tax=Elysia marginata TaxID=1093978 RepID=A0AAV4JZD6_9GAST|nr:mediator of RNA polymerase II transcription subunit 9-like [Elysia marginata]